MRTLSRGLNLTALFVVLGLTLPYRLAAQYKYFGFIGGANLSDMSDETGFYSTGTRWGGTAGAVMGLRTKSRMVVALEPAWSQMGGNDVRIDFVEVPLVLGGMGGSSSQTRVGGYIGIMPAFKVSCDIKVGTNSCNSVKGTSWFLPLGSRFMFKTGKRKFVGLDVRYAIPLGSSFDPVNVRLRTWSFRLVFVKGDL